MTFLHFWGFLTCNIGDFLLQLWVFLVYNKQIQRKNLYYEIYIAILSNGQSFLTVIENYGIDMQIEL